MDQDWFEMVQPRILSTLEEDLDHPPTLGEGEATARWGAIISDNNSDSATHVTRGLVRRSDWLGRFGHRKGMKPSRSIKSSPPRFIATPGELPFQEARPSPHLMTKMRARRCEVPSALPPIEKYS
jgi:hypothetical protein